VIYCIEKVALMAGVICNFFLDDTN